jgi:ribosomal protein S27E
MKVECVSCGHELNLDHWVFDDYEGPVKCFSCSRIMEVKTAKGIVYSINPSAITESKRNPALVEARD